MTPDWKQITREFLELFKAGGHAVLAFKTGSGDSLVNLSPEPAVFEGSKLNTKQVRTFLWANRKLNACAIWGAYDQETNQTQLGMADLVSAEQAAKFDESVEAQWIERMEVTSAD